MPNSVIKIRELGTSLANQGLRLCLHCRGHRFDPYLVGELRLNTLCGVAGKKKKKKNKTIGDRGD